MVTFEGIQHFASEIARRYMPEKIILFGSQANGKAGEDSDVDLLRQSEHARFEFLTFQKLNVTAPCVESSSSGADRCQVYHDNRA
jgi:predicted nucleotidyltransferase